LIDNQQQAITPATLELARSQNHTFLFKKDGYQDDSFSITSSTSGWVWGNVLLGGIIGGVVDLATGAARKLSHDAIHVTLVPLPAHDVASSPLVPVAAKTEGAANANSREVQLLELKSLLDKGLITQEEYDQKRMTILNSL
jgi:hypothetical protein